MAKKCPICGNLSLKTRNGKFRFEPPPNIQGGVIVVPNSKWEECSTCGERIIPIALEHALEQERYHRLGLLTPKRIQEIRKATGLSQVAMAQHLGVGDKTYTRWESGRSIQSKSSDNLIRLFEQKAELLNQFEAQRKPNRMEEISKYFKCLETFKAGNRVAFAWHGSELDPSLFDALSKRLKKIASLQHKKQK